MAAPDLVFIATNDLVGLTRGRGVPASQLESALSSGVGWVPGDLALPAFGPIIPDNPFGALGDLRLLPDADRFVDIPVDADMPAARLYLADQVNLSGEAWECCPRSALKCALRDLEALTGLRVIASFEHEFLIRGLHDEPPFSFARLRDAEPFGTDLLRVLSAAGMEPENWLPEYGVGQYEITLEPGDALVAADRAVLLKEIVRDLASRRGLDSTFAPLVDPEGTGNGVHVHLSLINGDGEPVLFDPEKKGRLSEIGVRFSAGILTHAAAITAWTAPSPISFMRLVPNRWSAGGVFLGERNREALLRICPTSTMSKTPEERQFNLEFRAVDATANPWLAMAAVVRAGLEGIKENYTPAKVWSEHERHPDVPALPSTTLDALKALETDEVADGWFSPVLTSTHLAVRRFDVEALDSLNPTDRCAEVARVY